MANSAAIALSKQQDLRTSFSRGSTRTWLSSQILPQATSTGQLADIITKRRHCVASWTADHVPPLVEHSNLQDIKAATYQYCAIECPAWHESTVGGLQDKI
eukprot:3270611-Amphidinium_carterae.2